MTLPVLVVDATDERAHEAKLAARLRLVVIGEEPAMQLGAMVTAIRLLAADVGLTNEEAAELVAGEPARKGRAS